MGKYILRCINDTQLVEAGATHLRCYHREGQLLASRQEGANLLTYNPATDVVRYLLRPKEEGENCTFLDWHWQTGAVEDLGFGSIWTHCCAFEAKGNFAEGGDWEDDGCWRGIAPRWREVPPRAAYQSGSNPTYTVQSVTGTRQTLAPPRIKHQITKKCLTIY